MADIKRLLNKKGWTGRELGQLELTNMALMFKQALAGKEPKPIIEQAEFRRMINAITDLQQAKTYNGYIAIHEWITLRYNIAQTQLQQAQLQYRTLGSYIANALFGEDVYRYIEQLPAIMTEKQYADTKAERVEAYLKDEAGDDLHSNVFNLVERAIAFYVERLQREPRKANPLKAIRKKYLAEPVRSKLILSRWNAVQGEGYYTLEDGRRSDEMSAEEWAEAVAAPELRAALMRMRATDGRGHEYSHALAVSLIAERKRVYFVGTVDDQTQPAPSNNWGALERDLPEGTAEAQLAAQSAPLQWHDYDPDKLPADLTKWDVLEQELLLDFYPCDVDGSGDNWSEANFTASMEDFVAEFGELVALITADIDKRLGDAIKIAELPVSKWATFTISWRDLYKMDLYGARAEAEADTVIFAGNGRALLNGLAILRPSDVLNRSPRIDGRGYYVEPDLRRTLSNFTLEAFFPEAEEYADNVEIVEEARQTLIESLYHLRGYNFALELVGGYFDVPEITAFQMDIATLEGLIRAYNETLQALYRKIYDTNYEDAELRTKKLQVLLDLFPPIDLDAYQIPADNVARARKLLKDFKAFKPEHAEEFTRLLFTLPEADENGEGAE